MSECYIPNLHHAHAPVYEFKLIQSVAFFTYVTSLAERTVVMLFLALFTKKDVFCEGHVCPSVT